MRAGKESTISVFGICQFLFEKNGPPLRTTLLELKDISLSIRHRDKEQFLLSEITARLPQGHFAAIIGPSGCGKSTLLKVIAGIREHDLGTIHWMGRDVVSESDLDPHEIGYVP